MSEEKPEAGDFEKVAADLAAAFVTFIADRRAIKEKFDAAVREAGNNARPS